VKNQQRRAMKSGDPQSLKNAFAISIFYLVFGVLWIYLSDTFVELMSKNSQEMSLLQTYKGWFFISITTLFLFILSYRFLHARFIEYTQQLNDRKKIEQTLREAKERFDHLAHIDVLTGLPNRLSLSEFLTSKSLKSAPFTLFFIDLDGFKEINDAYGHRFGDELLIRVTQILKEVFPSESYIVRTGGDEFAIILEVTQENGAIESCMTQLHDLFNAPIIINTIDVYITASIGIAIYPKDADNTEELLQKADAAMYRAKNMGRNTYSYYNSGLTQEVLERTTLASNLKKAIANHELLLYYQPQVDPNSEKMTGVEALLRWPTPEGMIPPSLFIPIAEERGLIVELGSFVLEEGFRMAKKNGLKRGD
jgi:polar amino acid transport system substrate-binding protein